ncbi:hypothetical protein F4604DRAFT_1937229 [Suillus subluteus]|nr:hypothetical protein F4604DRAFT_1937229 [Suillus subluteus]
MQHTSPYTYPRLLLPFILPTAQPNLDLTSSHPLCPVTWKANLSDSKCISGKNLHVPSKRVPAGIYLSINVHSSVGRYRDLVKFMETFGRDSRTDLLASFELDRMLGNGEVIRELQMLWDELLERRDEPFGGEFLVGSIPVSEDSQDIDSVTSLFHEALALRSQGQPDHPSSLYHLTESLTWRYIRERIAVHIQEFAQLYCKLLPLCPEGTYLRSIASGDNDVGYVIRKCKKLRIDASDEVIHLRRIMLSNHVFDNAAALTTESIQVGREAVSEGHTYHDTYLNNLAFSLRFRFEHQGRSHDLDEAICLYEEFLHGMPSAPRFNQRGNVNNINRAISLHSEALTSSLPGHPDHDIVIKNIAIAGMTNWISIEDLDEAINLYRKSLLLMRLDRPVRVLVGVLYRDEETPDEVIHLAGWPTVFRVQERHRHTVEVDDSVAKHVVKAFYEKMFEDLEDGDVMDCTKAAQALNHATYIVKREVPLEQRIVFIHIGV